MKYGLIFLLLIFFMLLNSFIEHIRKLFHNRYKYITNEDLKQLNAYITHMSGREFELFCGRLFDMLGYSVIVTQASKDGGKDIILNRNIYVECKHYSGSVGRPIGNKLYGVMCADHKEKGIIITTGTFTTDCLKFCNKVGIWCIDGEQMLKLCKKAGRNILR